MRGLHLGVDMTESITSARGIVERHLDLILVEELKFNRQLVQWMFEQAGVDSLPDGLPDALQAEYSQWDLADGGSAGENDLEVTATWANRTEASLLIEVKLTAGFQPGQGVRYAARAARRTRCQAVLIAPERYLAVNSAQEKWFKLVSIEKIANQLDPADAADGAELAERLKWRAGLLRCLPRMRPAAPADPRVEAVRDWFCEELAVRAPGAQPHRASMRTASGGWLFFVEPPSIVYKMMHGSVDIYLREIWPGRPEVQPAVHGDEHSMPSGFAPVRDTKGNLVLRALPHERLRPRDVSTPPDDDHRAALLEAVDAVAIAERWVGQRERDFRAIT